MVNSTSNSASNVSRFSLEGIVRKRLEECGINIGGSNRWDPQVKDPRFYMRIVRDGMLGLGDSYVDGWWDCDDLPEFFNLAMSGGLLNWPSWPSARKWIHDTLVNRQDPKRAVENVRFHYKLREEFVREMTGKRKAYSCAVYKNPLEPTESLDVAQDRKLKLASDKLDLRPGQRVLDIGCGWGSFLGFLQEFYGINGTGITPAQNQADYIAERYGPRINVRVQDYRALLEQPQGRFDRIASIGMFEHVGEKNLRTYMEAVAHSLAPDGIFVLHFFGRPDGQTRLLDPWTDKHIFPGICVPTNAQTHKPAEGLFMLQHQEDLGQHYDPTLLAWAKNFEEYAVRTGLKQNNLKLYRLWFYYLMCCAGGFRSRKVTIWQMVFIPVGSRRVYSFPARV